MSPVVDEYLAEARLGFEAALRGAAFPPTSMPESVDDLRWTLASPEGHRREVSRADRAVCALLSGDHLAATGELEAAGPVGTGLMCLRASVHAQRSFESDGNGIPAAEVATSAAEYLGILTECAAIPPPDRSVWADAVDAAWLLAHDLVLTVLPAERTRGPLALLAGELVARSVLARRAFAAVFVADFAALLREQANRRGMSALDCARQHCALTVAYLEGENVSLLDSGQLRLESRFRDADGKEPR